MKRASIEGGPLEWMRQFVERWLAADDPHGATLRGWLAGEGLPPVGQDEEPYVWILRGLPQGNVRSRMEEAVAVRTAALLDAGSERETGETADQRLYNLLMLAAGLSYPDALAKPLARLFHDTSLKNRSWRARPLGEALRSAIIENQLDSSYKQTWLDMLAGKPHPLLGGTVMCGFDGVLWMPPGAARRGEPAVDALGAALRSVAQYFDSRDRLRLRRRREFRLVQERVMTAYLRTDWPRLFVDMAHRYEWPNWTVQSLPKLAFSVRLLEKDECEYVLWSPYADYVGERTEPVRRLCMGDVLVLQLSRKRADELTTALARPEQIRCETDLPSRSAIVNAVTLPLLDEYAALDDSTAVTGIAGWVKTKLNIRDEKEKRLEDVRARHTGMIDKLGDVRAERVGKSWPAESPRSNSPRSHS